MVTLWIAAASFLVLLVGLAAYVVRGRAQAQAAERLNLLDAAPSALPTATTTTKAGKSTAAKTTAAAEKKAKPVWGVRISSREPDEACPDALTILDKSFPIAKAPSLPLPTCPYPHECTCFFIRLEDRRKDERRSGKERRESLRFETEGQQRRSGRDRRKRGHDWNER
jgi:hypothetical protein